MLIDVGVRKGFESHWRYLGDQVHQICFERSLDSFAECVSSKSVGEWNLFSICSRQNKRLQNIVRYQLLACFVNRPEFYQRLHYLTVDIL